MFLQIRLCYPKNVEASLQAHFGQASAAHFRYVLVHKLCYDKN